MIWKDEVYYKVDVERLFECKDVTVAFDGEDGMALWQYLETVEFRSFEDADYAVNVEVRLDGEVPDRVFERKDIQGAYRVEVLGSVDYMPNVVTKYAELRVHAYLRTVLERDEDGR